MRIYKLFTSRHYFDPTTIGYYETLSGACLAAGEHLNHYRMPGLSPDVYPGPFTAMDFHLETIEATEVHEEQFQLTLNHWKDRTPIGSPLYYIDPIEVLP